MKRFKVFAISTILTTLLIGDTVLAANDTTQEKTGDGNATCTVKAVVESTYSVSLPATLTLAKQADGSYKGEYVVGSKGNVAANQYVSIAPVSETFTMTGVNNSGMATASISQKVRKWTGYTAVSNDELAIGSDSYAESNGTVTVNLPTQADEYKGNFTFEYSLKTNS